MLRGLISIILLLTASTYGQAPASQPSKKLNVVFVTGGEAHDFEKLAPIVTTGIAKVADAKIITRFGRDALKDPKLADGFDAVIYDICYNGQEAAEYENLLAITRAGKPTVVIHATMHTFKPLPAWSEMLGMSSERHDPYQSFTTIKLDDASLITKAWPPDWKTSSDELYNTEKLWPTAHALLKVKSPHDAKEHIVAWTNTYGAARIFGTTLGHDEKTAANLDYQKLLANGLLWTCGMLNESPQQK